MRDVGCGMRVKVETQCGMTELSTCETKYQKNTWTRVGFAYLRQGANINALIFAAGMRDSLKIYNGIRDDRQKATVYGRYAENCDSNKAEAGKHSVWDGMAGCARLMLSQRAISY